MVTSFLGIGSYSLPLHIKHGKVNVFSLLKKAEEYDIHTLQIADNIQLPEISKDELFEFRKELNEKNMRLETGLRGLTKENLDKYIEITHFFGSHLLRCVIDKKNFTPSKEGVVTILKEYLPKLKEYDITIGIENHDRFFSYEFREIIEAINSQYVGIVLDTANSLAKEEHLEDVLDNLSPYTVSFHVKDYDIIRNPYGMGLLITGRPSGQGRLNIPKILDSLYKTAKSDFSSIIEFWIDEDADISNTLSKEDNWLKESIAYMHNLLLCKQR